MKVENNIEYAFALFLKKGLAGLSCAESMMHLCNLQDMLVWNGPFEPDCFSDPKSWDKSVWNKVKHTVFCCCLHREGNVDFLLMAKLVAISTLGNPPRLW